MRGLQKAGVGILAALSLCGLAAPAIAQNAAVTPNGGSLSVTNGNLTYGFSFSVSQTFSITALGYYDEAGDGLLGAHVVGLYDGAGNTLLTSGTVGAGTTATLFNGYRYVPVSYTLNPGTYTIAGSSIENDR